MNLIEKITLTSLYVAYNVPFEELEGEHLARFSRIVNCLLPEFWTESTTQQRLERMRKTNALPPLPSEKTRKAPGFFLDTDTEGDPGPDGGRSA